jgi:apolipoprotein N-acyltransferase
MRLLGSLVHARPLVLAAIAATSSLALAIASPPSPLTPLVWVGFAPLAAVVRVRAADRARRLFLYGWVGGLCVGLVGFPWMAETLVRFADFPWVIAALGLIAFSAWTAIPFGLWAIAVARGPAHGPWSVGWPILAWLALAACWPALFPYTVVIGLAEQPQWIQAAELGGVALVEAQVVAAGVLLGDALLASDRRVAVRRAAIAVAIPISSWSLGAWRMAALDDAAAAARSVTFGIVQPNVPIFDPSGFEKMDRLRLPSRAAQEQGAEIVVWPEAGAFPYRVFRPLVRDFRDPLRRVLAEHRTPTIFGAGTIERGGEWEYNTVYAMEADGRVVGQYDKIVLVPFGEYVPVVDPRWAKSIVPAVSHNNAGTAPARFVLHGGDDDVALGPLVCYEDIFDDVARDSAAQAGGLDAFVNLTIDTWFGATAEPLEHLALAQFRSVEHRIPMVRSVSAGSSSVVDHTGRVVASLPVRDPTPEDPVAAEVLVHPVALVRNTEEAPTVYARGGWLVKWICTAAFAIGSGWWLAARRRTQEARA